LIFEIVERHFEEQNVKIDQQFQQVKGVNIENKALETNRRANYKMLHNKFLPGKKTKFMPKIAARYKAIENSSMPNLAIGPLKEEVKNFTF
jgi:ATP-dependent Clp protease ATP-binding subunit ClpA